MRVTGARRDDLQAAMALIPQGSGRPAAHVDNLRDWPSRTARSADLPTGTAPGVFACTGARCRHGTWPCGRHVLGG